MRRSRAVDNSQAWQNAVCGDNPSVFVPGPNTQPPCQGLNTADAGAPGYPTYPAFGTGFTAGQTGPVTYRGSLIPQTALAPFLRPGPDGFITVDWNTFKRGIELRPVPRFGAARDRSSNTGASGGSGPREDARRLCRDQRRLRLGGNRLRYNVGVRCVRDRPDDRRLCLGRGSAQLARSGRRRPAAGRPARAAAPICATAPAIPTSLNFVDDQAQLRQLAAVAERLLQHRREHAIVWLAVSRTMTRPNPNAMLPGVNFSSPSADVGTVGNPALDPFISDNIDLGFEYYIGGGSYIAVAAFRKSIDGLHRQRQRHPAVQRPRPIWHHLRHADADPAGRDQLARRPGRARRWC